MYQSHTNIHIHIHTHTYILSYTGVYDISKGRGIAEGGGGLGVPFSLAIPRKQRVGPNGEKPGTHYHKHRFHGIPFLTPIDGSDTITLPLQIMDIYVYLLAYLYCTWFHIIYIRIFRGRSC